MENDACNYLPEFSRVREGIANKKWELTEKQDFHDWIQSSIVDCTTPIADFNNLIATLTSEQDSLQTTLDSTLASAFTELLSSVPGLDQAAFNQAFEDSFVLAQQAGTFDNTNVIPDNIPVVIMGCELHLSPLADQIPALN